MDSEITTITGCEVLAKIESVFHAMKAVETTNKMDTVSDASVRINKVRSFLKLHFLNVIIGVMATVMNAHKIIKILLLIGFNCS